MHMRWHDADDIPLDMGGLAKGEGRRCQDRPPMTTSPARHLCSMAIPVSTPCSARRVPLLEGPIVSNNLSGSAYYAPSKAMSRDIPGFAIRKRRSSVPAARVRNPLQVCLKEAWRQAPARPD